MCHLCCSVILCQIKLSMTNTKKIWKTSGIQSYTMISTQQICNNTYSWTIENIIFFILFTYGFDIITALLYILKPKHKNKYLCYSAIVFIILSFWQLSLSGHYHVP